MSTVTQTNVAAASDYAATEKTSSAKKNYGRTIGDVELSDTAAKYYQELRKKYGNMEFILVSEDQKANVQANLSQYAGSGKMTVLIDVDKVERMATDENYRKQYEGIIGNATNQVKQFMDSLGSNASHVKGVGITVNDGGNASFFAVVDKSLVAQKERIEKKAAEKAEQKKQDQKALEKKRAEKRKEEKAEAAKTKDTVEVKASSWEELAQKVNDVIYDSLSDYVRTPEEMLWGQSIDFRG